MRIAFSIDGGVASFPGLRQPVTLECDDLPPERSARIKALVERSGFFEVAPARSSDSAHDQRTYTVVIEDGARRRTLHVAEPITDPELRALIDEIRACVRR
jgi:hypothetical protein